MNRLVTVITVVAALGFMGCTDRGDLNKDCILVKKDPNDPKKTVQITEGDIASNPNRDVISFGTVECEDLVCVHEAGATLSGTATKELHGQCSKACLAGSKNTCLSFDESLDKKPETALSCRALLLDEQTLATLKQNDPATYQKYFGDTTSPYFCARAAHQ